MGVRVTKCIDECTFMNSCLVELSLQVRDDQHTHSGCKSPYLTARVQRDREHATLAGSPLITSLSMILVVMGSNFSSVSLFIKLFTSRTTQCVEGGIKRRYELEIITTTLTGRKENHPAKQV